MGKTYVPGLKLAVEAMRRYIARYKDNYKNNVSTFCFALADLLLDLADVLISYIEISSDVSGHYDPSDSPASSPYINQVNAAVDKFNATLAASEGV